MRKRILVVEDEVVWAEQLVRLLEHIADVDVVLRPGQGSALAVAQRTDFDVAFIDLALKGGQRGEFPLFGLDVAAKIRADDPDIGIVVYSGHIKQGKEPSFKHYKDCTAVADRVLSRVELLSTTSGGLSSLIDVLLESRQSLAGVNFTDDLETRVAVETIGAYTLDRLSRKMLPDAQASVFTALGGGLSGSFVFRIDAQDRTTMEPISAVMKVDTDENVLSRELHGAPRLGSADEQLMIAGRTGAQYRGWSGMVQPFVGSAVTLEELLINGTIGEVQRLGPELIDRLFEGPAGRKLREASAAKAHPGAFEMTPKFGLEVLREISSVKAGVAVNPEGVLGAADRVAAEVQRFLTGQREFSQRSRGLSLLHGDAHTRNVLILHKEAPIFIDLARRTIYPRAFDYAALYADLVLRIYDSAGGCDRTLQQFPNWIGLVGELYPLATTGNFLVSHDDSTNSRVLALLMALQSSFLGLPNGSEDEFAEALLFQMLRHVRFAGITYPKKLLCITWCSLLIDRYFL